MATLVILNVVTFASGLPLIRPTLACCCAMKSGSSCPMRARACNAGHAACSLAGHDASSATQHEGRALRAVIEDPLRFTPRYGSHRYVSIAQRGVTVRPAPPEPPPPRCA